MRNERLQWFVAAAIMIAAVASISSIARDVDAGSHTTSSGALPAPVVAEHPTPTAASVTGPSLALADVPTGASTSASSSAADTAPADGAGARGNMAWFVVPAELAASSRALAHGCWVRLYMGNNYHGRALSILGPANIRELRSPDGTGLNAWESAEVGPEATVTTYQNEDFGREGPTLHAGQRYPDLAEYGHAYLNDIESIKVECVSSRDQDAAASSTEKADRARTAL